MDSNHCDHRGMNTIGENWLLWKGPTVSRLICVLCHNFWTNYDLDLISTSKWMSEFQFCERYLCRWQKSDQKWWKNGHFWNLNLTFFFFQNWKFKFQKWPFYAHFWTFFWHLHKYLSQNWNSGGHFEVLTGSKS